MIPILSDGTCDHCGTRTSELAPTEYGVLCARCEYAQFDYEQRAGAALSPSTYGFLYDDE